MNEEFDHVFCPQYCRRGKGTAPKGASLVRDVSLPALVLHRDALEHNIRWMQAFVSDSGAELAPHGKTSMTPALFRRQLDAGAWASPWPAPRKPGRPTPMGYAGC